MLKGPTLLPEAVEQFKALFSISETDLGLLFAVTPPTMRKLRNNSKTTIPLKGIMNLYNLSPNLIGYLCGDIREIDFGGSDVEIREKILHICTPTRKPRRAKLSRAASV